MFRRSSLYWIALTSMLPSPAPMFAAERLTVGLTATRKVIEAEHIPATVPGAPRVMVLAGLGGDASEGKIVRAEARAFESRQTRKFELTIIPAANPDGAPLAFPPAGAAYKEDPESHALWRWIGVRAPDLVLIAGADPAGLASVLAANGAGGVGRVPARVVPPKAGLLKLVKQVALSEARQEMTSRLARTPKQVAEQLAVHYGQELNEAVYIPAFALIGRLRLGELASVEKIVAPYVDGSKDSLAKPTSSHLSGHLLFADLAARTRNPAYVARVRAAADLGFTADGQMREAMPLHNEMSDSVFMGCPILAQAGKLTGEGKYYDMALCHLAFMQKLCLRSDGIYRHSPLDEAAWGRGNAFPALGMALTLEAFPAEQAGHAGILRSFQNLMAALGPQQDENGMWRQVVDHRGAYSELSATCMIGAAMRMGLRAGWLDARSYQPRIERAWEAVKARTRADGVLMDVCESTGKQKSVEDYLRRVAVFDRDPRGGAMALLFATEMAGLR